MPSVMAPTADRILIHELFAECIEASTDSGHRRAVACSVSGGAGEAAALPDRQHGQIQEWLDDYDEAMPHHRHTTQPLGRLPLRPDHARTQRRSLAAGCARFRSNAGENAPGGYEEGSWGRNLLTLYQARLRDREAAYASLNTLFRVEGDRSLMVGTKIAPRNAYEMDYNTGATAGDRRDAAAEPPGVSAPAARAADCMARRTGARSVPRGGFRVAMTWKGGKLVDAVILASLDGPCRLRAGSDVAVSRHGAAVPFRRIDGNLVEFECSAGDEITVRAV